jgi:hypothetical protein
MFKWIKKIKKGKHESQFDMEISEIIKERNEAIDKLVEIHKMKIAN